jgi:hypothetical protein
VHVHIPSLRNCMKHEQRLEHVHDVFGTCLV